MLSSYFHSNKNWKKDCGDAQRHKKHLNLKLQLDPCNYTASLTFHFPKSSLERSETNLASGKCKLFECSESRSWGLASARGDHISPAQPLYNTLHHLVASKTISLSPSKDGKSQKQHWPRSEKLNSAAGHWALISALPAGGAIPGH